MKKIVVFGSTGSVGKNVLNVIRDAEKDFKVEALAVLENIDLLEKQIKEFKPKVVAVFDEKKARELKKRVNTKVLSGIKGIEECACENVDIVLASMSGNSGILPIISATN